MSEEEKMPLSNGPRGPMRPRLEEREVEALEQIVGCLRRIATALEQERSWLDKLFRGKR